MSDPAPQKPYRWTVMIYLAGDNNLTDECVHALTQMKEVEGLEQEKIAVLAQFDPKGGRLKSHRYKISHVRDQASLSGDFKPWVKNRKQWDREGYVDHSALIESRRENPKKKDRETNTGSPVTLFDFVTWCIETYEADSYMLVLSGHGGGTEKGYLLRDEHPADALTMWEMQIALEEISKAHGNLVIDILGMDCCLMTMAEVSHQLKGLGKLMVGSEGYSPIAGWPFKPVLTRMREELRKIPRSTSDAVKEQERVNIAKGVVEEYVNYYLDYSIGGLSVEQSSLDLRQTGVLTAAIDALADELNRQLALSDPDFNNALVLSHWKAQSYNGEQFVDLYDFCRLLQAHAKSDTVKGACGNVLKTEPDFVKNSCYSGPIYQYSYGVSIYFPWAELDPDYDTVRFGRDSKWVKFLENYVVATRREPRDPSGDAYGNNREAYAIRHTAGKHAPGKAMLPDILSMRNPPLSAGVSPCVENADGERQLLRGMTQSLSAE